MARMNKFTVDFLDKFRTRYFNNPNRVGMKYYQLTENGKTPTVTKRNNPQIGLIQTNLGWVVINEADISNEDVHISKLKYYKHCDVNADISANRIKLSKPAMELTFEYNMVIDLNQHYENLEETKMNNEVLTNEVVNTPATIGEVSIAPTFPTEACEPAEAVAPSMVTTASEPITSVADFLKMVHNHKESISDGKVKLSLAEVIERLDGIVQIQKIEQCTNEGRNFFVVQLSEQTYMYSFKMMTTIIAKWVEACGSVDNLNNMLSQTEIKMKLSKSEYNGKSYTRCDVI